MSFSNTKIAVITGAGSGIGMSTAREFINAGYTTVLVGRTINSLQALADTLGSNAFVVLCDITQPDQVNQLFNTIKEKFGRIDVLFNNAGISSPKVSIEKIEYQDWINAVNTNSTGTFLCAQAAFRLMKTQTPMGGRIINNGSVAAISPRPMSPAYTATKHAVTGLTKSLSLDGREFDIACGQIDCGAVDTPITKKLQESKIDPSEVARTVLHMAELPLSTNILSLTIMPTKMPLIGRG